MVFTFCQESRLRSSLSHLSTLGLPSVSGNLTSLMSRSLTGTEARSARVSSCIRRPFFQFKWYFEFSGYMYITSDILLLGEDLLVGIESRKQFFLAILDFSGIGLEIEESSKKHVSDFLLKGEKSSWRTFYWGFRKEEPRRNDCSRMLLPMWLDLPVHVFQGLSATVGCLDWGTFPRDSGL